MIDLELGKIVFTLFFLSIGIIALISLVSIAMTDLMADGRRNRANNTRSSHMRLRR